MVILKISERLKTISNYVIPGYVTADIGTDHGYLLKYLLEKDKIIKGFACDLNKKPLTYAERNLREYIEVKKAEIRLGSGLKPLKKEDNVQCVVIAGMGGKLMVEILEESKDFIQSISRIILAPNVNWEKVRDFGIKNGWKIIDEDLVLEDNKFYPVIVLEKGQNRKLEKGELFFGPLLIENKHPLLDKFVEFEKEKVNKNISRMRKSKNPEIDKEIEKQLKNWEEMSRCLNES